MVYNIVTNSFIRITDDKTKFINEQEFEFKGYMKVMDSLCLQLLKSKVDYIYRTSKNSLKITNYRYIINIYKKLLLSYN